MTDRQPPAVALEVWGSDYRQVLDTAVAAEELGFTAVYYGESPHGSNLETWSVLAGVAERTRSIRVGPVITNLLPSYRSFPLFVRQVHALAVISGGRLDLRTGTGASRRWATPWWAPVGVDYPGRPTRRRILWEWLAALHHVWTNPGVPFAGELVRFEVIALDPPVDRPPITVAAMGPASMAVAARHADVWEASYLSPDELRAAIATFDAVAAREGRPGACTRSIEVDAVTAPRDDDRRLLEAHFLGERGSSGRAALGKALRGAPAEVAAQILALVDAGADQLLVACVDPHRRGSLEALAEARQLCAAGLRARPAP